MLAYLLIFIYCCIAGILYYFISDKLIRNLITYSTILVLGLFSGLRYHTGWDWEAYDYFISSLPGFLSGDVFANNIFNYEPLFVITVSILNEFSISVFAFFALTTVMLTITSAKRYLGKYLGVFFVCYLFYGYFHNFSIIRQGISAAIFIYSVRFIHGKKAFHYLISIFVASLFHASSLILLPVYFVVNKVEPNQKKVLIFIVISFLFVMTPLLSSLNSVIPFLSLFGEKVNMYLSNENLSYKAGFSLKYLEQIILVAIFSFSRFRYIGNRIFGRYFTIFGLLVMVQLSVYSFLNDFSILYERIAVFFEVSQGIFMAMILVCFKGQISKFFIILMIFSMVFIRYERLFYHSNNEARLGDEAGHLERFENYCSIFDKDRCTR
ncbi:EpsG family protein [Photobacterium rosenbergii]|uniref:EpsG family protein n=1 Tax=Photobacterium rosenbergii TaxID=294936 RepID=UPI001C98F372|nr:EpsG family protein [Photobacterium rosenbergii]MBY5947414.1 EpsG family protein [Photobacterium rosenbergii]